ncbi:hypothetical protein AB0I81_30015 [Nonomuraea sp. NPDC050404]|uniref:hypothetical protein n=1 Tax=Nonomuraea sp. NPDC050404 TaxID=3155783 RepID=UPI0033E9DA52
MRAISVAMAALLMTGTMVGTAGAAVAKTVEDGTSAAAPWASVSGECQVQGYRGSIKAYYQILRTQDFINRFNWYVSSGGSRLGKKSNIEIRVMHNRPHSLDRPIIVWNSKDNVRKGPGGLSKIVRVERRHRIYITARFDFDRPGLPDFRCQARTRDF